MRVIIIYKYSSSMLMTITRASLASDFSSFRHKFIHFITYNAQRDPISNKFTFLLSSLLKPQIKIVRF